MGHLECSILMVSKKIKVWKLSLQITLAGESSVEAAVRHSDPAAVAVRLNKLTIF